MVSTVKAAQFLQPAQVTTVRPAQSTVTTQQLDITSLINSILPLFMLMMVMGMLMPMMKEMSGSMSGSSR